MSSATSQARLAPEANFNRHRTYRSRSRKAGCISSFCASDPKVAVLPYRPNDILNHLVQTRPDASSNLYISHFLPWASFWSSTTAAEGQTSASSEMVIESRRRSQSVTLPPADHPDLGVEPIGHGRVTLWDLSGPHKPSKVEKQLYFLDAPRALSKADSIGNQKKWRRS